MSAALVGKYGWLSQSGAAGFGEAGCVTVAVPATRVAVLDAFAADPGERIAILDASLGPIAHVALADTGDSVVAYEWNGYEGSRAEVLQRASRQGKAADQPGNWEAKPLIAAIDARRLRRSAPTTVSTAKKQIPPAIRATASIIAPSPPARTIMRIPPRHHPNAVKDHAVGGKCGWVPLRDRTGRDGAAALTPLVRACA